MEHPCETSGEYQTWASPVPLARDELAPYIRQFQFQSGTDLLLVLLPKKGESSAEVYEAEDRP